jgi:hypothetical protein
MRPHVPQEGPRRKRRRPGFEGLEARDLPSATPLSTGPVAPLPRPDAVTVQAPGQSAVQQIASAGLARRAPFPDPAVIANSINLIYGPNSATPRNPTPTEVKRETFTAKWVGTYTVGPPRFSDRVSTIHAYAKAGGSNQFLKGKLQLVLFPPADPKATPNPGNPFANQVTGTAALFTQNYLQTGGMAILDVSGPPASANDPTTLPTHLSWTFDSFSSAGPYTGPSLDFNQGTGVLDIHYIPDRRPLAGTMGSGRIIVAFQGVINTSQIISAISKFYS